MIERWKCVGYCRHCSANEDDSTFSKEWGHFEKSDEGVWVRADSAMEAITKLQDEIKWYRAALEEIEALASMVDEDSAYADRAYDALRRGSVSSDSVGTEDK